MWVVEVMVVVVVVVVDQYVFIFHHTLKYFCARPGIINVYNIQSADLTSTNLHCYSCWQDFLALLLDDLSVTQCDSISFELVSGTKLTSVEARFIIQLCLQA